MYYIFGTSSIHLAAALFFTIHNSIIKNILLPLIYVSSFLMDYRFKKENL